MHSTRINAFKLGALELEALSGMRHLAIALYVMALRPRMDFISGLVGIRPRISWQALHEWLYIEPRPGLAEKTPSVDAIRRAARQLDKAGLVLPRSGEFQLIFHLPLAETDSCAQKKPARVPPDHSARQPASRDTSAGARFGGEAAMEPGIPEIAKPATHPVSGNYNTSSPFPSRASTEEEAVESRDELQWPRGFDRRSGRRAAMERFLAPFSSAVAQTVLDEFAGALQSGAIRQPGRFFESLVRKATAGDWIPDHAERIAAERQHQRECTLSRVVSEAAYAAEIVRQGHRSQPPERLLADLARQLRAGRVSRPSRAHPTQLSVQPSNTPETE